jgi:hypothetical protein
MSYTHEQTLYAAVHENGLNDLFEAFFRVRGHYLEYGTPDYVPQTTAMGTSLPPIIIDLKPIIYLDIEYDIKFLTPRVDIVPAAPTGLNLGTNDFVIKTRVKVESTINKIPLFSASADVYCLCEPIVISSTPGTGSIGIKLKQVKIVGLPQSVEAILESIALAILQFALAAVHIPFNTMTVGAFVFQLVSGPQANNDRLYVRGNVI